MATPGDEPDDADLDAPKVYEPIPGLDELRDKLNMYMEQYNETVRGGKMDLVFFKVSQIKKCSVRWFIIWLFLNMLPCFI